MYKLIYCIRKRDDISHEEFYEYWRGNHAQLFMKVAADLGAVRYIQSHTTLDDINRGFVEGRGFLPPYDGVTEIWFDDVPDFETNTETLAMLAEDEEKIADPSGCCVFMTEEHVIFDHSS